MRTRLNIEDDVLAAAKEMANRQRLSAGQLISRLLREAMSGTQRAARRSGRLMRALLDVNVDGAVCLKGMDPRSGQG